MSGDGDGDLNATITPTEFVARPERSDAALKARTSDANRSRHPDSASGCPQTEIPHHIGRTF